MIFTTRDLDILRFLRWCRFVQAKDLTCAFSKIEVQNLEILRLIKLYQPVQAYTLTAAGNRLLDAAFPKNSPPQLLRLTKQLIPYAASGKQS